MRNVVHAARFLILGFLLATGLAITLAVAESAADAPLVR